MSSSRIEQLWDSSKTVLQDCALPTGAIIAANSSLSNYPATAENYGYSWARDAAWQLAAGQTLKMPNADAIHNGYVRWLTERAQGFAETSQLIKRYTPNGALDWRYGREYQPDQAAALLWALTETPEPPDRQTAAVITQLANGLTRAWDHTHFSGLTQDLWENRTIKPEANEAFTYTLVSAIYGLEHAKTSSINDISDHELEIWQQTAAEMKAVLLSEKRSYFTRKLGAVALNDIDNGLDASLLGLVFPFRIELAAASEHAQRLSEQQTQTVLEIDQQLSASPYGIKRYQGDTYDGITRVGGGELTAGSWPLLTFWNALDLHKLGMETRARAVYDEAIECLDELYNAKALPNNLIPEQLFPDTNRQGKGVLPLAWSHAMFALATKELAAL